MKYNPFNWVQYQKFFHQNNFTNISCVQKHVHSIVKMPSKELKKTQLLIDCSYANTKQQNVTTIYIIFTFYILIEYYNDMILHTKKINEFLRITYRLLTLQDLSNCTIGSNHNCRK